MTLIGSLKPSIVQSPEQVASAESINDCRRFFESGGKFHK
jgi:hypothetical protein